jgi:hypothetical protein
MIAEIRRWASRSQDGWAVEHAVATRRGPEHELEAILVRAGPEGPLRVQYRLEARADGTARRLSVELQYRQARREWILAGDGHGHWFLHAVPLTALTGALDVGLWCAPSLHAFPLRRLALPFGGHQDCLLAVLPAPDADWTTWHLRYTHLSGDVRGHRYQLLNLSTDQTQELWVDHDGWVLAAEGAWPPPGGIL